MAHISSMTSAIIQSEKIFERGVLERLFTSGTIMILDFLLVYRSFEYSISDIAKFSGVSLIVAQEQIDRLVEFGIVESRDDGSTEMYKISNTSPIVKKLDSTLNEIMFKLDDLEQLNNSK